MLGLKRIHANWVFRLFLESIKVASAWNKVLHKRFLQPDPIGLIPNGEYTSNNNYSKKAMVWLLHMGETDGVKIMHSRNVREYSFPNYPNSV